MTILTRHWRPALLGGWLLLIVAALALGGLDPVQVAANVCSRGFGYWKTHPGAWPVSQLQLGSETYNGSQLRSLLKKSVRGDASVSLAHHLITARFNVANGADPGPAAAAISQADALLSQTSSRIPQKIAVSSPLGKQMIALIGPLESFNEGHDKDCASPTQLPTSTPTATNTPAPAPQPTATPTPQEKKVVAWGRNDQGQIGDGTTDLRRSPVPVIGLPAIAIQVAGSGDHSLALMPDGSVYAWGANDTGQLGDGSLTDSDTPVKVLAPTGPGFLNQVVAIAGAGKRSFAVRQDGSLWAWGNNDVGQLGDGSYVDRNRPVQVLGLANVTLVAGGGYHSLALANGGLLYAWGDNTNGQLGINSADLNRNVPALVDLTNVQAMAGGSFHSLAVKSDGTVWAWGLNGNHQVDPSNTSPRLAPVQVTLPVGSVAAGVAAGNGHSLALLNNGTVLGWGKNGEGQLGNGSTSSSVSTPVQATGITNAVKIGAGGFHTVVRLSDGTLKAWGRNREGQVGDGSTANRRTSPVSVQLAGAKATTFSTGYYHNLAIVQP